VASSPIAIRAADDDRLRPGSRLARRRARRRRRHRPPVSGLDHGAGYVDRIARRLLPTPRFGGSCLSSSSSSILAPRTPGLFDRAARDRYVVPLSRLVSTAPRNHYRYVPIDAASFVLLRGSPLAGAARPIDAAPRRGNAEGLRAGFRYTIACTTRGSDGDRDRDGDPMSLRMAPFMRSATADRALAFSIVASDRTGAPLQPTASGMVICSALSRHWKPSRNRCDPLLCGVSGSTSRPVVVAVHALVPARVRRRRLAGGFLDRALNLARGGGGGVDDPTDRARAGHFISLSRSLDPFVPLVRSSLTPVGYAIFVAVAGSSGPPFVAFRRRPAVRSCGSLRSLRGFRRGSRMRSPVEITARREDDPRSFVASPRLQNLALRYSLPSLLLFPLSPLEPYLL